MTHIQAVHGARERNIDAVKTPKKGRNKILLIIVHCLYSSADSIDNDDTTLTSLRGINRLDLNVRVLVAKTISAH